MSPPTSDMNCKPRPIEIDVRNYLMEAVLLLINCKEHIDSCEEHDPQLLEKCEQYLKKVGCSKKDVPPDWIVIKKPEEIQVSISVGDLADLDR